MAAPSTSLSIQHAARLLTEGRIAEATEHLEALVARLPAYVTAYVLLARAYETAGRLDDALAAWHHAHFLMPGSPLVQRQRRRLLRRLAEPTPAAKPADSEAETDAEDSAIEEAPAEPVGSEAAPEHEPEADSEIDSEAEPEAEPETPSLEPEPEEEDESDVVTAEIRPPTASAPAAAPPPEGDDENGWRVLGETASPAEPASVEEPDFLHPSGASAFTEARFDEPEIDEPEIDEPEIDEPEIDEPEIDEPEIDEPTAGEAEAPPAASPAASWVDDIEDPLSYDAPPARSPEEPVDTPDREPEATADDAPDDAPDSEFADLDFGTFSLPNDFGGSTFEDDFGAPAASDEPSEKASETPAIPSEQPAFDLSLLDSVDDLDSLIEQLENAPRITPHTPLTEDTDDPDPFGAGELVSETLARIYETQQQFAHAARAYDLLADQHPERAAEFRERAEAMRRRTDA